MSRPLLLMVAITVTVPVLGQTTNNAPIRDAVLAPLFYQRFACTEHVNGELRDLGDALGSDCLVLGGMEAPNHGFMRFYKTDGTTNDDWYGWHVDVHAPFDGVIMETGSNAVTNTPGTPGQPPPGYIKFKRADGIVVVYAHLDDIRVHRGDPVKAGQVVARDGNNGTAKNPHVHVGAYLGNEPLQIRWDLAAESQIPTLAHPQSALSGPEISDFYKDRAEAGSGHETGPLHIVYSDGTETVQTLPPLALQNKKETVFTPVGFSDVRVAEDHRTMGWTIDVESSCTSDHVPLTLVLFRDRHVLRSFEQGLMVWSWMFVQGGEQVAVVFGSVNGTGVGDYRLYDVTTGRLMSEVSGKEDIHALQSNAPEWAKRLEKHLQGQQ